jgi:CBS domain-containing protein
MKASELMTASGRTLRTCTENQDIRQCALIMQAHDVGCLPVLDSSGNLVGIVTDRDICCRVAAQGLSFEIPICEIMSRPVWTCRYDADMDEIEQIMRDYRVRRLPVVDSDHRLLGIISIADLVREGHGFFKERDVMEVLESVTSPT